MYKQSVFLQKANKVLCTSNQFFCKKPTMYYVEARSFSAQIKQFISHFVLPRKDGLPPSQQPVLTTHKTVKTSAQQLLDLWSQIHPEQHVVFGRFLLIHSLKYLPRSHSGPQGLAIVQAMGCRMHTNSLPCSHTHTTYSTDPLSPNRS